MRVSRSRFCVLAVLWHTAVACSDGSSKSPNNVADSGGYTGQNPLGVRGDPSSNPDRFESGRDPFALETQIVGEVIAGEELVVNCAASDETGEPVDTSALTVTIVVTPDASVRVEKERIFAERAGTIDVSCAIEALRLVDPTPVQVRVLAAAPAFVDTLLDRRSVVAGEHVAASCYVTDAFGNEVREAPQTLRVTPSEGAHQVDGLGVKLTRSGVYELACDVAGAETRPAPVEVVAGPPVAISIAKVPDEAVYGVGQVIEVATTVRDAYGNPVPGAEVTLASDPVGISEGRSRLRYDEEGNYRITATTADADGDPVVAETTATVDGVGPKIRCGRDDPTLGPLDGSMWRAAEGTAVPFVGTVSDAHGVADLVINGKRVAPDKKGHFTTSIPARYGLNVVDIAVRDRLGTENTRQCAFIASDRFLPEDGFLSDDVVLALSQDAIDDRDRNGGIDSLNDVTDAVVNSAGLQKSMHNALLAANPLKPTACDQRVLGICVLRSGITYLDSSLEGPNSTAITLIDGGFHVRMHVEKVRVRLDIAGTFDSQGWVEVGPIDVDADMSTVLSGGRPHVSVRDESVQVVLGSIRTDFKGLRGFILDIVLALARGRVRSLLDRAASGWMRGDLDALLDGTLSGLDIRTFGATVDVRRLGGGAPIPVSFGLDFSRLTSTPSRLTFGIATRFSTKGVHALPSLGIPLPPGEAPKDPSDPGAVLLSIHSGLFAQLMHTLWRGGFFEAQMSAQDLGAEAAPGLAIGISAGLPPVTVLRADGDAQIDLASLRVTLRYPGLFDTPLELWLSARTSTTLALQGNDLAFSKLEVEELYFGTPGTSLDGGTRDAIEGLLLSVVQKVVSGALNDALPALPIPSFTLPASVAAFDLTPGSELGLVAPDLAVEGQQLVLRSRFGAR